MSLAGKALGALMVAALLSLAMPTAARAHANLVHSQPPANSVVQTAPPRAVLWFDDPLEPRLNALAVLDANGTVVSVGAAELSDDRLMLSVALPPQLPPGPYTVAYRTVSTSDGHNVRGFYRFSMGALGEVAEGPGTFLRVDWSLLAAPAPAVLSWLNLLAALTVVGGLILCGWVLDAPARQRLWADQRVSRRARGTLVGSLALLLGAEVLALAVYVLEVREASPLQLVTESLIPEVAVSSRYGAVWLVRGCITLLLILGVVSLSPAGRVPAIAQSGGQFLLPGLGALLLLTFSSQSHSAAAAGALGTLTPVFMDWVHLLATAVWFGGVFFLAALLRDGSPSGKEAWMTEAIAPFAVWVLAAAAVLLVSGTYQTGVQAPQPVPLHDTGYGWILTVKLALMVLVLLVGVVGRHLLAVETALPLSLTPPRPWLALLRTEAALAGLALLAAAWLANTGPPREAAAAAAGQTTNLGERTAGDLRVGLALRPRPGRVWEMEVSLADVLGAPLSNAGRVTVGTGMLGTDLGWSTVSAAALGQGRYRAQVQWFDRDGVWGLFVTVRRRGLAEDVTALYGLRTAQGYLAPLNYAVSVQTFYLGLQRSADFWGLVEFAQEPGKFDAPREISDLYITLTDPKGAYLEGVADITLSAFPNIGPGGGIAGGFRDRAAETLGPGRFLVRRITMDVLGAWTVRVRPRSRGQGADPEGLFSLLVTLEGVTPLGGDFPPGHH